MTVVGVVLGCEIVMEKEPEAVRVAGFCNYPQVTVTEEPKPSVALLRKTPSIYISRGGSGLVRVTVPTLVKV